MSIIAACGTAFVGLSLAVSTVGASAQTLGTDDQLFRAGQIYAGTFADPSLLAVNDKVWVLGTSTGGNNVPAMHSYDLGTWRARAAYPLSAGYSTWKQYNDAMPHAASWARTDYRNGRRVWSVWAPSVARVGKKYVMSYAVPMPGPAGQPSKRCISMATAPRVRGPYTDKSTAPIVCSSNPLGSIDPQVYARGDGSTFLIWKNSGVKNTDPSGSKPVRIWSRRLNAGGTAFASGTTKHFLLRTAQPWEGNIVEAPAMISFRGRYYLFYAGNRYQTASYATGYAICAGPLGPCHRPTRHPLLATGGDVAGPGGATPVVDSQGRLRLAYSAWDPGHVGFQDPATCLNTAYGCNTRRLHIAMLAVAPKGLLGVIQRG